MSEAPLQIADLHGYDWQGIVDSADRTDCKTYSPLFYARSRELAEAGDELGQTVFALLGDCTSPYLNSESKDEPLRPMVVRETSRSAIPSDIRDHHLALFPELARLARDPELRARLADIAWLRCRDHLMAQLAIESYLESASRLDTEELWLDAKDRVERALRLAAQLNRGNPALFIAVINHIESVLVKGDASGDRRFQPLQLMELLIEFNVGDKDRWSGLAESLAIQFEANGDWERSEAYWDTKAAWDHRRKDHTAKKAAQVRAAEMRVNLARDQLQKDPPDHLLASIFFQRAVEGMRHAGEAGRAEALHAEMLSHQQLSLRQMHRLDEEFDISQYVTSAIEAVRGKPLDSALFILVTMQDPPSVESLREYSERLGKQYVFASLFPTMQLDHQGRVSAVKPSRLSNSPEEVEAAIQADMFDHARHLHEAFSAAFIEPARDQIVLDHHISLSNLRPIVSNNPLVAPGRAELVLRGLHAGLVGDFMVCAISSSRRSSTLLGMCSTETVSLLRALPPEGIQEEHGLPDYCSVKKQHRSGEKT